MGNGEDQGRGRGDAFGRRGRGAGRGWQPKQYRQVPPGRDTVESSQQGADRILQQRQQQSAEQGTPKKKRAFCFRCKCNGHVNEVCKADLDCIICNKKDSHLSSKCPILKMPKPSADFFGYGKKGLAFVQVTDMECTLEASEQSPNGLVTVAGARLTAEVVQSKLARTARMEWNWEALPHGEDSFLVAFPSDEALQSMVDIGFHLKNHGATITVSAWEQDQEIVPSYELEEVWVHVSKSATWFQELFGFLGTWHSCGLNSRRGYAYLQKERDSKSEGGDS